MGFFDKAKAAAVLAKKKAAEAAQTVAKQVEDEFGDDDLYRSAKQSGKKVVTKAKEVAVVVKDAGAELLEEAGQTGAGKAVGRTVRSATQKLSNLPVFSVAADTARARNGVASLHQAFVADPHDPEKALLLAEALERVNRDLTFYNRVRAAVDPSRILVQQAVKAANTMGATPSDPTQLRLLKLAFGSAIRRLRANPRDPTALHVLSRVYLIQGDVGESARFAKLAILADPAAASPWITLARSYVAADQSSNAEKAARRSVRLGASYGNKVLADVLLAQATSDDLAAIDRYEATCGQVTARGRREYLGVDVTSDEVFEATKEAQASRLRKLMGTKEAGA